MTTDDDVLGRARVTTTPELSRYYESLAEVDAGALWTVANDIEPWYPQPKSVPVAWSWQAMRPLVMQSLQLVSGDDAGRRVVMLVNPGRRDISAAVGLLYTGLQIMGPGEAMTAHRHQASALRFVLEGQGAWTTVDGNRLRVRPGDFAITPNGTWHEHGNDGDDAPVIWQDGLDIPLVNALDAGFYEVHPNLYQQQPQLDDIPFKAFGSGILQPDRSAWTHPYSPLLTYPWARTHEALENLALTTEGSPHDGVIMQYVNPLTGGSVMPTMGAHMQRLAPGFASLAHRHTGSVVYTVAEGSGRSIVAGKAFDWSKGDVFVVPSWAWHEHANHASDEPAYLFSFNDFPVIRALGFWREQAFSDHDGHQPVISSISPSTTGIA